MDCPECRARFDEAFAALTPAERDEVYVGLGDFDADASEALMFETPDHMSTAPETGWSS